MLNHRYVKNACRHSKFFKSNYVLCKETSELIPQHKKWQIGARWYFRHRKTKIRFLSIYLNKGLSYRVHCWALGFYLYKAEKQWLNSYIYFTVLSSNKHSLKSQTAEVRTLYFGKHMVLQYSGSFTTAFIFLWQLSLTETVWYWSMNFPFYEIVCLLSFPCQQKQQKYLFCLLFFLMFPSFRHIQLHNLAQETMLA